MNWWLIILPVSGALAGWLINSLAIKLLFYPYQPKKLFGFRVQGVLAKHRPSMAKRIGVFAGALFSIDSIEQKITDPGNLDRIMPVIEEHVDEFLRIKLPKEMPMISMFIGEKTVASMKKIFMQELVSLFPQIMKNYAGHLKTEFDPGKIVEEKITRLPMHEVEEIVTTQLSTTIRQFKIIGAAGGFVIGLIQVLITLFFLNR